MKLKWLLLIVIVVELIIFTFSNSSASNLAESFRLAARYSGRLSLIVFLITFYQYCLSIKKTKTISKISRNWLYMFAIVHLIHFGFLATNVYLNNIPLEVPKIIGGAIAYVMIVLAPFKLTTVHVKWQWIYFCYVSFVMLMTYVARIKGDFEGAEPFWLHYLALSVIVICCIVFGRIIYTALKRIN